jgi:hypothetical protein
MRYTAPLPILAAVLSLAAGSAALAQVAAESAILTGGVSSQGRAARSLGSAISGSFNRAADSIRSPRTTPRGTHADRSHAVVQGNALPEGGNDLKDTDAATYQTGNSAAISVSGRFISSEGTACVENCQGEAAGTSPAP